MSSKKMASLDLIKHIVDAGLDVKAEDPQVLDLNGLASFTDYFVILSGRSDRQVQAIADRIIESLREHKERPISVEGQDTGHWILIDFGPVVVHVFYQETRDFYALEKLWGEAPRLAVGEN